MREVARAIVLALSASSATGPVTNNSTTLEQEVSQISVMIPEQRSTEVKY